MNHERLAEMREGLRINQAEFARRAGLSLPQVIALEEGRSANPRLQTLTKIAAVYGMSADELLAELKPAAPVAA
jgi:transcriptional regulator with XRE-family HTH domain